MDKKKIIFDIINSKDANRRYNYMIVEKLIIVMLKDYIKKQNKEFIEHYKENHSRVIFDGYAPEGFSHFKGPTIIDIKILRSIYPKSIIFRSVERYVDKIDDNSNLLFILPGKINPKIKDEILEYQKQYSFKISIWDIDDLIKIFDNNDNLFIETYDNLNTILLKDTIKSGINRDISRYKEKRQEYIGQLEQEYNNDNMVLFLGAGASRDANVATWETLITNLFVELMNKELSENKITLDDKTRKKL